MLIIGAGFIFTKIYRIIQPHTTKETCTTETFDILTPANVLLVSEIAFLLIWDKLKE